MHIIILRFCTQYRTKKHIDAHESHLTTHLKTKKCGKVTFVCGNVTFVCVNVLTPLSNIFLFVNLFILLAAEERVIRVVNEIYRTCKIPLRLNHDSKYFSI